MAHCFLCSVRSFMLLILMQFQIFDTRTGGLGASSALYHRRREVLCQARDLVSGCDCCLPSGCPCCTLSTRWAPLSFAHVTPNYFDFYPSFSYIFRCTRFNNDLSRCGAKLLLQLLVQHFDAYHAAAPGGFLPVNVTAGHLSANSTAATTTATTAAQASSGGGGGGGADPSPRKARRKKALSATAFRGA